MTDEPVPEGEVIAAVCPGCNRYIGPVAQCPYCHSDASPSLMLRILRIGSVVLAVAGLALLYLAVTHRELPIQKIGEITPLMNYAYVRLSGTVPRDAYVGREDDAVEYVAFSVEDGTGTIRVKARDGVAHKLSEMERIPQAGMPVDVVGRLRVVKGSKAEMRLGSARQLLIGASQK